MSFSNIVNNIRNEIEGLRENIYEKTKKLDPRVRTTLNVALPVIALVSAVFASVPTTCAILGATVLANYLASHIFTDKAAGRVIMALGVAMLATKILIPFAPIIAYAVVSGGLCFAGNQIQNNCRN